MAIVQKDMEINNHINEGEFNLQKSDDNFAPSSPSRPVQVFLTLQRWWGGGGEIFCPRTLR